MVPSQLPRSTPSATPPNCTWPTCWGQHHTPSLLSLPITLDQANLPMLMSALFTHGKIVSNIIKWLTVTQLLISLCFLSLVPQGPPLSVTTSSGECTSMNISWSPPAVTLQSGVITNYKLLYTRNSSLPLDQRTSVTVNVTNCSQLQTLRLTNLVAESRYYISVSAGTSVGFGPYANIDGFPSSRRKLPNSTTTNPAS